MLIKKKIINNGNKLVKRTMNPFISQTNTMIWSLVMLNAQIELQLL